MSKKKKKTKLDKKNQELNENMSGERKEYEDNEILLSELLGNEDSGQIRVFSLDDIIERNGLTENDQYIWALLLAAIEQLEDLDQKPTCLMCDKKINFIDTNSIRCSYFLDEETKTEMLETTFICQECLDDYVS